MSVPILRTIKDFEEAYGDPEMGQRAVLGADVLSGTDMSIAKTDYPLLTGTGGNYSAFYGAELWAHINLLPTAWGLMPKVGYPRKFGWRALTAAPTNKAQSSADSGAIADTEIPSFAQVSNVPAIMYKNFDAGVLSQFSAEGGQAIDWETYRDIHGDMFAKGLSQAILADAHTLAGNKIESIDRIFASQSEESGCTDAGDLDIYTGIDRSAVTWADSTVLHNSGTDRDFDLSLVNQLARTVEQASGVMDVGERYWLTKHDTWQKWTEFLQPQQRFTEGSFSISQVNGIGSARGKEGAFSVSTYHEHPVIRDADVAADTIGRVYFGNTKYVKMGVAVPTKYVEAGGGDQSMLLLGKFATEGMFWMAGDPLCTGFHTIGKLRELQ